MDSAPKSTITTIRWPSASSSLAALLLAPHKWWRRAPPYPTDIYTISGHPAALIDRYGTVANAVRKAIETADEAGDANTADIFTEASRGLDKALWFLEAHIQESD